MTQSFLFFSLFLSRAYAQKWHMTDEWDDVRAAAAAGGGGGVGGGARVWHLSRDICHKGGDVEGVWVCYKNLMHFIADLSISDNFEAYILQFSSSSRYGFQT